jgi:hypothetical protein
MSDPDLTELRTQAAQGDRNAVAVLVELAGERGDFDELRHLADNGSRDAADVLVELAGERGDRQELSRLASSGNQDAADVLAELDEDSAIDDGSAERPHSTGAGSDGSAPTASRREGR